MIVPLIAAWQWLRSTGPGGLIVGACVIAVAGVYVFYEGVPIGPLRNIPGIHYIAWEGRVAQAARLARAGYVLESRAIAAEAKAAEKERQLKAANIVIDAYMVQARNRLIAEAAEDARLEDERTQQGNSDPLTADDIRWLRRNSQGIR